MQRHQENMLWFEMISRLTYVSMSLVFKLSAFELTTVDCVICRITENKLKDTRIQ